MFLSIFLNFMMKLVISMMMVIDGHLLHTDRVGHLPRLVMKTAIGNTFLFDSKQQVKHSHSTQSR